MQAIYFVSRFRRLQPIGLAEELFDTVVFFGDGNGSPGSLKRCDMGAEAILERLIEVLYECDASVRAV